MADLGSIAMNGLLTKSHMTGARQTFGVQRVVCGATEYITGMVKSTSEGDPAQPSLKMLWNNRFRFRWVVGSGSRSLSIKVKNPNDTTPRPKVTILANPDIGVSADVTGSAGAGTGWQTIGPLNISPSSAGAVWVVLENPYLYQDGLCYWDNIQTT